MPEYKPTSRFLFFDRRVTTRWKNMKYSLHIVHAHSDAYTPHLYLLKRKPGLCTIPFDGYFLSHSSRQNVRVFFERYFTAGVRFQKVIELTINFFITSNKHIEFC